MTTAGAGEKQGTEGDQTVQGQQNADVARTANDVSNASPAQQQAGTNTATSGTPVSGTNTATAGTPVSGGNTAAPAATQGDDSGAGESRELKVIKLCKANRTLMLHVYY